MKIVMIHGQNHKGSTYNIGRMIVKDEEWTAVHSSFYSTDD